MSDKVKRYDIVDDVELYGRKLLEEMRHGDYFLCTDIEPRVAKAVEALRYANGYMGPVDAKVGGVLEALQALGEIGGGEC